MKELREVKNRYDFSLESRQVVLIVSGIILVLMLSFLMGTLFGRNLAQMASKDTLLQEETSPAPASGSSLETTTTELAASGPEKAPLIKTKEFSKKNSETSSEKGSLSREAYLRELESMKVPAVVEENEKEPSPKTSSPSAGPAPPATIPERALQESEEEKTPSPGMSSSSQPTESKRSTPSSPPKRSATTQKQTPSPKVYIPAGSYTIQLASLPHKEDAERMVAELQSKRYDAYMLHVNLPGKGTFYRVRVGHYSSLDQAKKALAIIQARERKYYDAWITQ